MFPSAYETTPCKNHRMGNIYKLLEESYMMDGLLHYASNIFFVTDEHKNIPQFAHPIYLPSKNIVVVDTRFAGRLDRTTGKVKGGSDFNFLTIRSTLMAKSWVGGNTKDLMNVGDLSVRIYSRLMAENISKRMGLDINIQNRIQIISAYFYLSLFDAEELIVDEESLLKNARRISSAVVLPADLVIEVLEEIPAMKTTAQFCDVLIARSGTVRLEKFSPSVLYAILGGIWYGSNAVETVTVSIEHPPTFVAMLYQTVNDRSYRKSIMGQIVQRVDKSGTLSGPWLRNVNALLSLD